MIPITPLSSWFYNKANLINVKVLTMTANVLHNNWQRVLNSSIFWRTHLFCLFPFFQILPDPCHSFVALFLWLNGWSSHIWCAVLLNDNLVSEVLWCVLCLTHNVVFYQYPDLISYTHKHTHTTLTRMAHPCKYIFTAPAMCSQQLPLLH